MTPVEYTFRVEGEFSPGVWTSFGKDLIGGVRLVRGTPGNSPKDVIAITGTFDFTLRNDLRNTAGLRGYYSPNHAACRVGFVVGMWVRVIFRYASVDYTRWMGKLAVIDPTPGKYGAQTTLCQAVDAINDLAESDIREVTRQINQSEDVLIVVVLDSLPTNSQPRSRAIDGGIDVFPVAFDDLGDGTKGLETVERLVTSAQGRAFVRGDGAFVYKNNLNISLLVPSYTFNPAETVITVPTDLRNVFNRVRLTIHPKTFSAPGIVLAAFDGKLDLAAGATQEIWLNYKHPVTPEVSIGGTDFITPVSTTDYIWNSLADGTGTNLTFSVSVTATFFAAAVKLSITNNASSSAHLQLLQVRGTGIFDESPLTVESYTARSYGNRPIDIDLPYQGNVKMAQSNALFIETTFRDLEDQVLTISFLPQRSAALMTAAMALELGQVVGCSDPQILPNGTLGLIQQIEMEVNSDGILSMILTTIPWIVQPGIFGDTLQFADPLIYSSGAAETRIDFANINYSEVAA